MKRTPQTNRLDRHFRLGRQALLPRDSSCSPGQRDTALIPQPSSALLLRTLLRLELRVRPLRPFGRARRVGIRTSL